MILIYLIPIPILLCAINIWLDMHKGESVGEYMNREEIWAPICISAFIPFVGLLTLIVTIPTLVFNLIKNVKK